MKKHLNIKTRIIRNNASWGNATLEVYYDPDGFPIKVKGLSDAAVKETLKRVEEALRHSGYRFVTKGFNFNLKPHNIGPKDDTSFYDLPFALAIISCTGAENLVGLNKRAIYGRFTDTDNIVTERMYEGDIIGNTLKEVISTFKNQPKKKEPDNTEQKLFEIDPSAIP